MQLGAVEDIKNVSGASLQVSIKSDAGVMHRFLMSENAFEAIVNESPDRKWWFMLGDYHDFPVEFDLNDGVVKAHIEN